MQEYRISPYNDEGPACKIYSLCLGESENTLADEFLESYEHTHPNAVENLVVLLDDIAEKHGAIDGLFRPENEVEALPPKPKQAQVFRIGFDSREFPLRLYVLRISEKTLIIFGGGEKTGQTIQESEDLHLVWKLACRLASAILEECRARTLVFCSDSGLCLSKIEEVYFYT